MAVAFLMIGTASAADTQTLTQRHDLNIPAGDLATALELLAKQSGADLVYRPEQIQGLKTEGVKGDITAQDAIKRLLQGTSLQVSTDATGAMLIAAPLTSGKQVSSSKQKTGSASGEGDVLRLAQAETTENTNSQSSSSEESSLEDSSKNKIQEIIVTAQKRNEREQDVPSSITVLSGSKLLEQGVVQLADYAKQIPGMSLIGGSGAGQGQIALRGIATGNDRTATVGVYLDDVPFTPSSPYSGTTSATPQLARSFDPDLADVENIEVLKGPQSTLYGASAQGGLIKYVTRKPDFNEYESKVRIEGSDVGNGGAGYGGRASVNIPLVSDRMGLRAAAFYRRDPGFVDNAFDGASDVNDDIVKGARVSLRAKLLDNLETTFSGLLQNIDAGGAAHVYLNSTTLRPLLGKLAYTSPIDQTTAVEYRSISNTTELDVGFATLTNIASYSKQTADNFLDFTGVFSALTAGAPVSYEGNPHTTRYSDEIRLASVPGRVEWMLGGFYTHEKSLWDINIRGTTPTGDILPPTSPVYEVYTYRSNALFKEKAVFGNLTYHFTDRFDATIGTRYSANDQSYGLLTMGLLNGAAGARFIEGSSDGSAQNYLATATYKPKSNWNIYVRAASAYRPGGPNQLSSLQLAAGVPPSFKSDELWNYEAGVKGALLNQRMNLSVAVYHMDWKDVQITQLFGAFSAVGNAAKAKNDGAEASVQIMPLNDLTLSVSGAYNNARISADALPIGAVDGDPLPYSPKFTAAIATDYRFSVSQIVNASVGLTWAYRSSQDSGFSKSTTGDFNLPSYDTLDLRVGLHWSRYSAIARVDNATSSFGLNNASLSQALGRPLSGAVIRPRTFGVSLEARF